MKCRGALADDAAARAAARSLRAADAEGERLADAIALGVRRGRDGVRAAGAALEGEPDELSLREREGVLRLGAVGLIHGLRL
jgi:hypothetical protein